MATPVLALACRCHSWSLTVSLCRCRMRPYLSRHHFMQLSGGRTNVTGGDEVPASNVCVKKKKMTTHLFLFVWVFFFLQSILRASSWRKKKKQCNARARRILISSKSIGPVCYETRTSILISPTVVGCQNAHTRSQS